MNETKFKRGDRVIAVHTIQCDDDPDIPQKILIDRSTQENGAQ